MPDLRIASGRVRDRDEACRVVAEWQELRLKGALGQEFRSNATRVVIRKPGWLPGPLYRWLMRTIVLEEREQRAPAVPRRERRQAGRRR